MPRIKLESPPLHLVVPDTNILWHEDKKNPVSPAFNEFWKKNAPLIPLKLIISEVVLGELHFQQATSATKLAKTITQQTADLCGVTHSKYDARLDSNKIKKQVGDKLEKWLKSLSGSVSKTPTSAIDWTKLIHDAIWRNEPFTYDPKDRDKEKGFRDAMVLETFVNICNENKGNTNNIIFLCNDYLLKSAAESRLKHNKRVLIFESLNECEAYIKLTQQNLKNKFVQSIQNHARAKFYTQEDLSTIYYRDKIKQFIQEKFASELLSEFDASPYSGGLLGSSITYHWSVSDQKWWISATRFDELISPREYHWLSTVTAARFVTGTPIRANALSILMTRQEIQLIQFDIKWKASVKADGRFHDMEVTDIIKANVRQDAATDDSIARWKLQVPTITTPISEPLASGDI